MKKPIKPTEQEYKQWITYLASGMQILLVHFFGTNFKHYLKKTHSQNVKDAKHCIRIFIMQRYGASPLDIARAETKLRNKKTDHATIYHSKYVVEEVLPVCRPSFLQTMKAMVLG